MESRYFTLPTLESAEPNLPDTTTKNEERILLSIMTQLTNHDAWLTALADETANKKITVAEDLVKLTKTLPHSLALNILIEASRHTVFNEATTAHQVIIHGINKENDHRSPLILGELTFAFIKKYQQTNPKDVAHFLNNPDLLLMWMNKASSLEISRLFQEFYLRDTEHYINIRKIAEQEHADGQPAKGLLCYTLMCPGRLTENGIANTEKALTWLTENESAGKYDNIAKSLRASISPTIANITNASGCYINLNKLELETADLSKLQLRGASLKQAKLVYMSLYNSDFTGALLDNTSFVGSNLKETILQGASLRNANLALSMLTDADLSGADLSGADLSQTCVQGANLKNARLDNTNIDDTEIITRAHFATPAAFATELTRLHNMISGHKHEPKLRDAIIHDLIRYTRTPAIDEQSAVKMLKLAYDHSLFKQHKELHIAKAGVNLVASAYYSFFPPEKPDMAVMYETDEQKRLRSEYVKREAHTAKVLLKRPPMPEKPPTPPAPTFN